MVSLPKRWFSMTASVSGRNFRVFWSTFFRSSGRLSVDGLPVLYDRRHISVPAIMHSPIAERRHLLSRETGFETARSSFWRAPPCPPAALFQRSCVGGRFSGGSCGIGNAVNRQEPPQASILLAETNIFLLWRLEWKRV